MTQPAPSNAATTGQPAQALAVVPCGTLPKLLLHEPGGSGRGADFTAGDHPSLNRADSAKVFVSRFIQDSGLLNDMRAELGFFAGSEGLRMVDHFASGTGAPLRHQNSSPIGRMAASSSSFITMRKAVETRLAAQLSAMAASGTIDCNALVLPSSAVPRLSFTFDDGSLLKAIIGGTQGRTVSLTALSIDHAKRKYRMTLRYEILDDFGVDTSDLYTPGLIAFWVLQHERSGYIPFKNIIDLTVTSSGSF
jgi:hypothetical protein